MLKKEYIAPELTAIRIETMQMIATSSKNLNELLEDDNVDIIVDDSEVDVFNSHNNNYEW